MLKLRRPMAKSSTKARGWPAISPQSVTGLLALWQALMTCDRTCSTGGASGWQRWLTLGLSRSAAIRYCTRSLEPIETKSTCGSMSLDGNGRGGDFQHHPERHVDAKGFCSCRELLGSAC